MGHNSQCVLLILRLKSIAAALLNFHCSFSHELSALRKWSVLRIDILHDHRLTFNIQWGPLNAIHFFVWRKFNEEKFRYYFPIHMERSQETLQPGYHANAFNVFFEEFALYYFSPFELCLLWKAWVCEAWDHDTLINAANHGAFELPNGENQQEKGAAFWWFAMIIVIIFNLILYWNFCDFTLSAGLSEFLSNKIPNGA